MEKHQSIRHGCGIHNASILLAANVCKPIDWSIQREIKKKYLLDHLAGRQHWARGTVSECTTESILAATAHTVRPWHYAPYLAPATSKSKARDQKFFFSFFSFNLKIRLARDQSTEWSLGALNCSRVKQKVSGDFYHHRHFKQAAACFWSAFPYHVPWRRMLGDFFGYATRYAVTDTACYPWISLYIHLISVTTLMNDYSIFLSIPK